MEKRRTEHTHKRHVNTVNNKTQPRNLMVKMLKTKNIQEILKEAEEFTQRIRKYRFERVHTP